MDHEKIRLLVVEDTDADFRIVAEYIKDDPLAKFEIFRCRTLSEALNVLARNKFQAALLDLGLPDSRGLSIIDAISRADPRAAILVLTGMDDENIGAEALERGAQDYLVKGKIQPDMLFRGIRYAIERKKARDVLERDKETFERLVAERTAELVAVQVELERAKRLSEIGRLAATVAHELRNPLGVIQASIYNLKRKLSDERLEKHISNIEAKITESSQIIDNLLFYTRIKPPNFETVDLRRLLDECRSSAKERFRNQSVTVETRLEPLDGLHIKADPVQLSEIFNNIIVNSYQAFNGGDNRLEIGAKVEDGRYLEVNIRDNGAGIEASVLKRVFEPFFTAKSKGTGLGLAICQELVGLHNGKIEIESEQGKGTSVTVTLPIGR